MPGFVRDTFYLGRGLVDKVQAKLSGTRGLKWLSGDDEASYVTSAAGSLVLAGGALVGALLSLGGVIGIALGLAVMATSVIYTAGVLTGAAAKLAAPLFRKEEASPVAPSAVTENGADTLDRAISSDFSAASKVEAEIALAKNSKYLAPKRQR